MEVSLPRYLAGYFSPPSFIVGSRTEMLCNGRKQVKGSKREIYTKYKIHKNKPLSCTERNHYLNQCLVFILVHRTPVVHQTSCIACSGKLGFKYLMHNKQNIMNFNLPDIGSKNKISLLCLMPKVFFHFQHIAI
jgi:hypothetical protein